MSESDFPLQYFCLPASDSNPDGAVGADLSPEGFLVRLGVSSQFTDDNHVPVDALISESTLDDFFDRFSNPSSDTSEGVSPEAAAEAKRWRKLRMVLERNLRGAKLLRVGTVDVRCYLAGIDKRGDITGLVTTSIET